LEINSNKQHISYYFTN